MQTRIIRSDRRAKTVSARIVDGVLEVAPPAHLSDAELQPIIAKLQARLARRAERRSLDDDDLSELAARLNRRYFQGGFGGHRR
ncbi:MAG TPA: hypothetical protein VNL77_03260 [Roseiflexaceae bacterium]|nr:hypothetical protein [Roseiflexaceae bacterium]